VSWPHTGTGLAVIGHPIGHSLSPQMHNAALAAMAQADARFAGWRYHAFDIDPGDLPAALDQMGARGFRGVNLTVQWGNDPARMSESGGDLVEERGERTIVVKNVSALGRYEAAYGFRSGKTVSLVRFPDAGREYTWDGATVSFAGEDHDTTAAGRYVLGEKGELKTP